MSRLRVTHFCITLTALAWIILPLTARSAQGEVVTADRPAEYMIYQYPDSIMVLKFDVPEAEFSARTIGPENALIKSSALPARRIGPVFQYIEAVGRPRQLTIEVTPQRAIDRSAIGLEILQFGVADRNVANLVRAYQLFSTGAEAERSNAASTWGMKAYSMRNAAGVFTHLGMQEMSLWSEYFAAHLVLHRLDDPLMALELVEVILMDSVQAGFEKVELAARILESDALLRLARGPGERGNLAYVGRAHQVLAEVARLAERQGLDAEHGRALYHDGLVHELAGEPGPALERFRQALEIIARSGDEELLNEVRATSAAAYEAVGSTAGAIEMLDEITDDLGSLPQGDADLELAGRLLEKGRLLNGSYRFSEAIPELSRALELQQSKGEALLWVPAGLELAWAHYSLGDADQALRLLISALPAPGPYAGSSALARAYGSLAHIYRERGETALLAQAREKQGDLLAESGKRSAFLLESALDVRSRDGAGSAQALELMRQARQVAAQTGDELNRHRADLYLCFLQTEYSRAAACELDNAVASFDALRRSGVPSLAADASLAWSRILRQAGRPDAARNVMDQLLDDLYWYTRVLPGVLGAWYAEHRVAVARDYLALVRASQAAGTATVADGRPLLLAMERLRMVERADFTRPGEPPLPQAEQEPLRNLLARREAAAGAEAASLAAKVNQQLAVAQRTAGAAGEMLTVEDLDRMLAGLGRSDAVLSYYFDGPHSQALVARQDGVRAVDLPTGARVQGKLDQFRDLLSGPESPAIAGLLDDLGRALIEPVAQDLPVNVYLLPVGPLRGVPLDALRVDGRLFLQEHRLVNLAALSSIERRAPRMQDGFRERVFLGGNPQVQDDPFSLEVRVSQEIAAVTDQFVGPGLHIVQGVALQKHEFEDERFAGAALIHLALAGTLDLDFPDRSRLLLAPSAADLPTTSSYLAPADVRGFDLSAQLAVLSGTLVVGEGRSPADGRLAFVADFLEAGVAAALVSFWPAGEAVNAEFATDLYRRLQARQDIEVAFQDAKRARAFSDTPTNLRAWAGFQLFIR